MISWIVIRHSLISFETVGRDHCLPNRSERHGCKRIYLCDFRIIFVNKPGAFFFFNTIINSHFESKRFFFQLVGMRIYINAELLDFVCFFMIDVVSRGRTKKMNQKSFFFWSLKLKRSRQSAFNCNKKITIRAQTETEPIDLFLFLPNRFVLLMKKQSWWEIKLMKGLVHDEEQCFHNKIGRSRHLEIAWSLICSE